MRRLAEYTKNPKQVSTMDTIRAPWVAFDSLHYYIALATTSWGPTQRLVLPFSLAPPPREDCTAARVRNRPGSRRQRRRFVRCLPACECQPPPLRRRPDTQAPVFQLLHGRPLFANWAAFDVAKPIIFKQAYFLHTPILQCYWRVCVLQAAQLPGNLHIKCTRCWILHKCGIKIQLFIL